MSALDNETAEMLAESVAAYGQRMAGSSDQHIAMLHAQGWLQTALPEHIGGLDFGVDATAIIARELARHNLSEPVAAVFMAARLMALVAPDCAPARALAEEGKLVAVAWEDGVLAASVDDNGCISGEKRHVAGAAGAASLLVVADRQGTPVLLANAVDAEGVACEHIARLDGGSLSMVRFDRAIGTVIAQGEAVNAALRTAHAETSLVIAAELMGHIDEMLALTLEHLKTRRQFGQTLGAFQALQHKAADLYLHSLLSKTVLERALEKAAKGLSPDDLDRLSCRARARLNDTAVLLVRGSIQLFGALGITDECMLSPHIKRVLALLGLLGTSVKQRRNYASLGRVLTRHKMKETEPV